MSKLLKGFSWVFGVSAPILFTFYLNRSVADVRYTLSERIPTSIGATPETVQQLEVKNIGNALANRVVVKIQGRITKFSIAKYSSSDPVEEFSSPQLLEIVYPQLPPQAGFKLVLTSPDQGIEYMDVLISHEGGIGKEALSPTNLENTGIASALYFLGFLIFTIAGALSIRRMHLNTWKESKRDSPLEITQRKQPWYVLDSEWPQFRIEVLKTSLSQLEWWQRVEDSPAYKFLLHDGELDSLTASERHEVTELSKAVVRRAYAAEINTTFSPSSVQKVLRIKRPDAFPASEWNDLEKEANDQYVTLRKRRVSPSTAEDILAESKPHEISDTAWSEIVSYSKEQYGHGCLSLLMGSSNPLESTKEIRFDLLDR